MKNEKYKPIKFDSWQELAKYVIDGGDVYYDEDKIEFNTETSEFNVSFDKHLMNNIYTKKQPTLEELIAIKPRLCWVWDGEQCEKEVVRITEARGNKYRNLRFWWYNAQMLTDDEIKQFLSGGE